MTSWDGLQSGHEFILAEKVKIDQNKLRHYAWASGDYNTIHFDEASAKSMGLPGVIIHGMFELGLMGIAVEELIEEIHANARVKCRLKDLESKFVGAALVNDELTIAAKVSSTTEQSFTLNLFMFRNGDRAQLTALGIAKVEAISEE